jgi:hypothetical protein
VDARRHAGVVGPKAISIYVTDPDGHSPEFISMLGEAPRPDLGIVNLSVYENL